MWIYILLIALLAIALVYVSLHLFRIKKQMRIIREELEKTKETDYNRLLSISLVDHDLVEMTAQINDNLDFQKKMKWEAQKSELQLRQSISDIAHDLRTPITVVKGNLQMMEKDEALSEESKESLRICSEKTDLLKKMVDEFFELSYLESEGTPIILERMDLTEFLAYFVISHEAVIKEKGIQPEIQLPEKSVFVNADKDLLTRMLENLFNNVVKHSAGEFCIALREVDNTEESKKEKDVQIIFSNPVPTDVQFDIEHLFDRTYRGNKARTGGGPGGLGLYIVKLLAQKQGILTTACREKNSLSIMLTFPGQQIK